MHHARNSDEHGIDPISVDTDCKSDPLPADGTITKLAFNDGIPQYVELVTKQGEVIHVPVQPPKPILITVKDDRFGDTFDPPDGHLGTPLTTGDPYQAGRAFLDYLSQMVEEAQSLPQDT